MISEGSNVGFFVLRERGACRVQRQAGEGNSVKVTRECWVDLEKVHWRSLQWTAQQWYRTRSEGMDGVRWVPLR